MRSCLLATAAALTLLAPLDGNAEVRYTQSGQVAWTTDLAGVSTATGTGAVNLSGFGDFWNGTASAAPRTASWSNGSATLEVTALNAGGAGIGPINLPSDASAWTSVIYAQAASCSGGTCASANPAATSSATLTLSATQKYFGGLFNVYPSGTATVSFYNGATLVDTVALNGLGTKTSDGYGMSPQAFYLNVDFLGASQGFNRIVVSETGGTAGHQNGFRLSELKVGQSAVSLTSLTSGQAPPTGSPAGTNPGQPSGAPAPVLGATPVGGMVGLGLLGMLGLACRRSVAAA